LPRILELWSYLPSDWIVPDVIQDGTRANEQCCLQSVLHASSSSMELACVNPLCQPNGKSGNTL
jgi:hypothetical protein